MEQADILIVNDNLEIQKIIQILLTGEDFRVTEAEDAEQALQNLKKVGFDLIILDIMMPGMDGYLEVLKLGGSRNIRKLKVIRLLKECEKNDRRNWCSHDCERGHSIFYGGNRVFRERIKHIPDEIQSGMC